jgi:hypothetical protein
MQPLYATTYGNGRQPLMETVGNHLSSYIPCYATAYGNGISPPKIPRTAAPILKKG